MSLPPDLPLDPLQPVHIDTGSAHELRAAITATRTRLHEVLHDRTRRAAAVASWSGPHRDRFDTDAADLLAAGRVLAHVLDDLLAALDAEVGAATR